MYICFTTTPYFLSFLRRSVFCPRNISSDISISIRQQLEHLLDGLVIMSYFNLFSNFLLINWNEWDNDYWTLAVWNLTRVLKYYKFMYHYFYSSRTYRTLQREKTLKPILYETAWPLTPSCSTADQNLIFKKPIHSSRLLMATVDKNWCLYLRDVFNNKTRIRDVRHEPSFCEIL